jgi:hypothetical protein
MAERFYAAVRLPETVDYQGGLSDHGFEDRGGKAWRELEAEGRRLWVSEEGTREAYVTVFASSVVDAARSLRAALDSRGGELLAGPEPAT